MSSLRPSWGTLESGTCPARAGLTALLRGQFAQPAGTTVRRPVNLAAPDGRQNSLRPLNTPLQHTCYNANLQKSNTNINTAVSGCLSSHLLRGQSTHSPHGAWGLTGKRWRYTNNAPAKPLICRLECDGIKYVKVCLREINIPVWSRVQSQQSGII